MIFRIRKKLENARLLLRTVGGTTPTQDDVRWAIRELADSIEVVANEVEVIQLDQIRSSPASSLRSGD